jgi:hypothetical protein
VADDIICADVRPNWKEDPQGETRTAEDGGTAAERGVGDQTEYKALPVDDGPGWPPARAEGPHLPPEAIRTGARRFCLFHRGMQSAAGRMWGRAIAAGGAIWITRPTAGPVSAIPPEAGMMLHCGE